jgi:single-strand DNA-binding protein
MSQDNHITLRGYLTAEPKLHQKTPAATPVTEIRVGSTPRRLDRETGEWQDAPTSYYTVKCWRRLAINAVSSLHKGDMVVVRGRFYMNNWVDNQQRPRSALEIEADSLGHDLTYGWSHFLRASRPQPERSAGVTAGEVARQDTGSPGLADDDEYSAIGDPVDSADPSAAELVPGDQGDPGPTDQGDPGRPGDVGYPSADASADSITDSDGIGALVPGEAVAASGLTEDADLREAEAVPF